MTIDFQKIRADHQCARRVKYREPRKCSISGARITKGYQLANGMHVSRRSGLQVETLVGEACFMGRSLTEQEARAMFTRDVYLAANRRTEDATMSSVLDYCRTLGVVEAA